MESSVFQFTKKELVIIIFFERLRFLPLQRISILAGLGPLLIKGSITKPYRQLPCQGIQTARDDGTAIIDGHDDGTNRFNLSETR